jgi:phage shock protein PspC (stress-responsive transcriptional regulator)
MSDDLAKSTKKSAVKINRELKKLRRITDEAMVGGVCAGVAYRLATPTWLVRLIWFATVACAGFGLGLYILLWIFVPDAYETPGDYEDRVG